MVAQFVDGIKIQFQNPVQACLAHFDELGRAQQLAHEHAEHGRGLGVLHRCPGKMHPGTGGIDRNQQAICPLPAPERYDQLLPARLGDPVYPGAHRCFNFLFYLAEHRSIQRHNSTSLLMWAAAARPPSARLSTFLYLFLFLK